ncbi:MAG: hypothetical protein MPJ50_04850 [Pirellulales bacterium]|nr:hypothetical protein [Pirellulales bacterium]
MSKLSNWSEALSNHRHAVVRKSKRIVVLDPVVDRCDNLVPLVVQRAALIPWMKFQNRNSIYERYAIHSTRAEYTIAGRFSSLFAPCLVAINHL